MLSRLLTIAFAVAIGSTTVHATPLGKIRMPNRSQVKAAGRYLANSTPAVAIRKRLLLRKLLKDNRVASYKKQVRKESILTPRISMALWSLGAALGAVGFAATIALDPQNGMNADPSSPYYAAAAITTLLSGFSVIGAMKEGRDALTMNAVAGEAALAKAGALLRSGKLTVSLSPREKELLDQLDAKQPSFLRNAAASGKTDLYKAAMDYYESKRLR
jgi:hypothetical protein